MSKVRTNSSNFFRNAALVIILALALPVFKTVFHSQHPLTYMIPNALLFTGARDFTRSMWMKFRVVDKNRVYEHEHIPVVNTFAELEKATEGWLRPAIVRGLFSDTPAMQKWKDVDYLTNSVLKDRQIPVVRDAKVNNVTSYQNDRYVTSFGEAYHDILTNTSSLQYIFFPVMSRFHYTGSELASLKSLQEEVNQIVHDDLQIEEKLWKGFGSERHTTFRGSQIIAGRGTPESDETTGTNWHCAIGNNYFIQVAGRKRWYFMHPKHSAQMAPLRHGLHTMATGDKNIFQISKHLPLEYADLEAGDMLYNPDWYWHTIKNYEGLSVGVPIREANFTLSAKSNLHFTAIIFVNKLFQKFNINIDGYAPA